MIPRLIRLVALATLLVLPSAGALSVRISPDPLVQGIDDATGGALHPPLAPLEAPPAATATAASETESSAAPIEPAPSASGSPTVPAAAWALTFGAALAGLVAGAARGPLWRVRSASFVVFWRVLVGGAILIAAALLFTADVATRAGDGIWLAATAVAWGALVVGALAVRATGRVRRFVGARPA